MLQHIWWGVVLAACPGASLTALSAQLMSVLRRLIWHIWNVLIKWWASMCLKELSPIWWCVEKYLWRSACVTSQVYFRVTSVLMCCWGKILLLLRSWRFSLLLFSFLGSGLDFSREEIRFFLPFHSVSVLCLHQLVVVCALQCVW